MVSTTFRCGLSWLELEMALALRNGNAKLAAEHYRDALPLLKSVATFAHASLLHGMGKMALADDQAQRSAANSAAIAENKRLMADAPEQLRDSLKSELARRWHEETGQRLCHLKGKNERSELQCKL